MNIELITTISFLIFVVSLVNLVLRFIELKMLQKHHVFLRDHYYQLERYRTYIALLEGELSDTKKKVKNETI